MHCSNHPKRNIERRPRNECKSCWEIWVEHKPYEAAAYICKLRRRKTPSSYIEISGGIGRIVG